MKNIAHIFALALGLLFLSACGKKDDTDETNLPLEVELVHTSSTIEKCVSNKYSPKDKEKRTRSANTKLKIDEDSVIITALLISDKEIKDGEVFADIVPRSGHGCFSTHDTTSTNCKNNKIVFPPYEKNAKNLRIIVKLKEFADSYSKYFDTCDGKDKTIEVKLLPSVKFKGKAIRSDGIAITNMIFSARPRGLYEGWDSPGRIYEDITTDSEGEFEINGLLPEHYKFKIEPYAAQEIETNVILFSDQNNYIEFVFPKLKYQNIKGIVLYEHSGDPAEGIEINCKSRCLGKKEIKILTNAKGEFNVSLPISTTLKINEPGFAKVKRYCYNDNENAIIFLLRETGNLTGIINTETGEPVSGARVSIYPKKIHSNSSKINFVRKNAMWEAIKNSHSQKSYTSDENGTYIISNIPAPQIYSIYVSTTKNYFLPKNDERKVEVFPGKTTSYDVEMIPKKETVVMVQLKDINGKPVLNYSLEYSAFYASSSSGGRKNVCISTNDIWYCFDVWTKNRNVKIDLLAKTDEDDKIAKKKNIFIRLGETNKIILTLYELKPLVAGFVYKHDMSPYIDGYIRATVNQKYTSDKCDYLGFFEITETDIKPGTKVELSTYYEHNTVTTNIFAGDNNIEWILPELKYIKGRVFTENIYTPATNFSISVINKSSPELFQSENGNFSCLIREYQYFKKQSDSLNVYAFVPGYAPVINKYKWNSINNFDIGNIIVTDKPAKIIGRVIDHEKNPVIANIPLTKIQEKDRNEWIGSTDNDKSNGKFEFTGLPPGIYQVSAQTRISSASSEEFELRSGETYSLPDLIIIETNAPDVLFEFILPDGSPAANARINCFNKLTDENGLIKEKVRTGKHDYLTVEIDEDMYNTEKFEIDSYTKNITFKLIHIPSITGSAYLDGKPMNNVHLQFKGNGNYYGPYVSGGKFEMKAKPGKYVVTCRERKVANVVELSESGENKIDFKSGTAAFEFEFSIKGRWVINLTTKIDNKNVDIAYYNSKNDSGNKISKLSAGEYKIYVQCSKGTFYTNFSFKATLNSGETKKIKL